MLMSIWKHICRCWYVELLLNDQGQTSIKMDLFKICLSRHESYLKSKVQIPESKEMMLKTVCFHNWHSSDFSLPVGELTPHTQSQMSMDLHKTNEYRTP